MAVQNSGAITTRSRPVESSAPPVRRVDTPRPAHIPPSLSESGIALLTVIWTSGASHLSDRRAGTRVLSPKRVVDGDRTRYALRCAVSPASWDNRIRSLASDVGYVIGPIWRCGRAVCAESGSAAVTPN